MDEQAINESDKPTPPEAEAVATEAIGDPAVTEKGIADVALEGDNATQVVSFAMPESSTLEVTTTEIIVDAPNGEMENTSEPVPGIRTRKRRKAAAKNVSDENAAPVGETPIAAAALATDAATGDEPDNGKDNGQNRTEEELIRFRNILEGVLLVSGEAVSVSQLAKLFDPPLTNRFTTTLLNDLKEAWKGREVELTLVASGWRFQGSTEVRRHMERLSAEKAPRYSRAVMETLAIIAYRQPVTRGEIESIRGVAVSTNIIKALEDRQWVEAVGHKETPGRPSLYATTKKFLDDLGLRSLAELPPLAELDSSHILEMPDAPTKSAEAPLNLASPIITKDTGEESPVESGDAGVCGDASHENQENDG